MKAKKLAAFLAAALAVTSLNVTAFATDPTPTDVTLGGDVVLESATKTLKSSAADIAAAASTDVTLTLSANTTEETVITLGGTDVTIAAGSDTNATPIQFSEAQTSLDATLKSGDTSVTISKVTVGGTDNAVDTATLTTANTSKDITDASAAVGVGDTVTFVLDAALGTGVKITVNSVEATKVASDTNNKTYSAAMTKAATKLTFAINNIANATATIKSATITKAAAGGDEGDPTPPAGGDKTSTLTSNNWTEEGTKKYNGTVDISVKTGTVAEIKALDNYTEQVTIKAITGKKSDGTTDYAISDIQAVAIIKGTGVKGGYANFYVDGSQAYDITLNSAFEIKFDSAKVAEKLNETGDVELVVQIATKGSSDTELTGFPTITYTNKAKAVVDPGEGGGDAPENPENPGGEAPSNPGYVVITPNDTTAADTTAAAPEVVTGANGESVEAPKDVVPAGATLEAKEQTKEEAVKAVEAVKATDANKEVVETIKKAIEDAKAAVMDINLVKDGKNVQPNGTIKVTVKVPEALKSAANLFVYRVEDDGTFTDVKATVKDGKIEFTTSHFSTYIITSEALTGDAVVTEAAATTPAATTAGGNTTTDDKNQATGVVLAVIPAMLAAAGVIAAKKRK